MSYNNTIDKEKNKVLNDVKDGKEKPWKVKKLNTLELAKSYKRLGMKKSYRVRDCGSLLEFKRYHEDGSLKLHQANFCKVRLCPMCAWRRSLKIFGQVSKVMERATKNKEYRFIFLTLTCRNISSKELSGQLDTLFKSYHKLMRRKAVKSAVKGWFRALEVTHNIQQDTYHPHFHVVLAVNKSYFKNIKIYINQDKWTQFWKESMKIDYTPIVDVRAFKTGTNKKTSKSVAEAAKYAVKEGDFIIRDNGKVNEKMTDLAVWILDGALASRRLVSFGGELKKIHKSLNLDDVEDGDLINTNNDEELREDLNYIIERYQWNVGYKQYIKLENKRK